jgi:ornithine carbamoyltransferase
MGAVIDAADWPQDLLTAGALPHASLAALLELAAEIDADPGGRRDTLDGAPLACFFDPPTTGMTVAVAVAASRLGMVPVELPRAELLAGAGEPLADTVRTFSAAAMALFVHGVDQSALRRVAAAASVPVLNGLSDEHRPCQALADLLALRKRFGALEGLVVAFVGDGSDPIAHSLLEAGALAAMDVRVACPPDLRPSDLVLPGAEAFADLHGGRVSVTEDPESAVAGADVVYTGPWVPPGREAERQERVERLRRYRVHPGLMSHAADHAVFMHCLPARRGDEVSEHVVDGARSLVWEQVACRAPALQAALYVLVRSGKASTAANS